MYFNGLTVTFWVAVVSQGISQPNTEKYIGFSPPLDSRHTRSRMLKSDIYLQQVKFFTSVAMATRILHGMEFFGQLRKGTHPRIIPVKFCEIPPSDLGDVI